MVDPVLGELTDDAITADFRIWQRRRGHRYSLDDLATAWEAAQIRPEAARYADLGTGIGSVLLMVTSKLGADTALSAIEAQAQSFELLARNLERNHLIDRVLKVHGDLRQAGLLPILGGQAFDLVTGTPPYMPPGRSSPSTDEQRTYARIEMRGGVEEYLAAAGPLLAPDGRFVVCCDARNPERALQGAEAASLSPLRKRDVIPRAGHKGPLFTVWTFAREQDVGQPEVEALELVVRDESGARTEAAHTLRRFFGLSVNIHEPPSPKKHEKGYKEEGPGGRSRDLEAKL